MMKTTIKQLRKLFLLMCLITAGVQSAWADDCYIFVKTCEVGNLTFDVYDYYYMGAYYSHISSKNIAVLKGIAGTEENVTIPYSIENGGENYFVNYIDGTVSNNFVKTLTFKNTTIIDFYSYEYKYGTYNWGSWKEHYIFDGTLSCPSLETIIFEGDITDMNYESPRLQCGSLKDIYFKKSTAPSLSGSWSEYSTAPAGNITAHVAAWTEDVCEQKHQTAAVWSTFHAVVPYTEGPAGSTATIPFKDSKVKALCVANWDTNGDGKLTFAEAAAVTSLGEVFYKNTEITSFMELQYFTGLTSLESAFYGCSALEEIIVPYGVTSLYSAFGNCAALKTVLIPETVTNIAWAFNNTTALEYVDLPSGLTTIGERAFQKSGLKSVDIPETVTTIGTLAFAGCSNLKMLYIPSGVTSIKGFGGNTNNLSFGTCTELESIAVDAQNNNYKSPDGCNAIIEKSSNRLILGCRNTVIPDGVVTLGGYSFYKQPITSVVIPASVTTIENLCFYQCAALTSVECKRETPPTIGTDVFYSLAADAVLTVPHGCSAAYSSWAQYFGGGIVEAEEVVEPSSKPVWIISQSDDCPNVRISILTSNEQSSSWNLMNHFVRWSDEIDPTSQYWLLVAKNTEGRPIRVIKNGVDVTNQFAECSNDNYFFYVMDPTANEVWEISYVPLIVKTVGVSNPDLMEITAVHTYTNGSIVSDGFNTSFRRFSFDGSEDIASVRLEVVPEDRRPIRVMRNNEDVTYDYIDYDAGVGEFDYEMVISQNDTWAISYDTSHRQTIILNGNGGVPGFSEFGYEYLAGEYYFNINKGVNYIDLPEYNKVDVDNGWATMTICAREGETFKAVRNGEDVTTKFSSRVLENNNTRIIVYELDDSEIEGGDTQAAFGFQLRDPAVWEITIDDGKGRYDLNNDGKVNIADVTTVVNEVLRNE